MIDHQKLLDSKGIKLTQKAMKQIEEMIDRVTGIEKWAVDISCY